MKSLSVKPQKDDSKEILVAGGILLSGLGLVFLALWLWDGYAKEFKPRFIFERAQCRIMEKGFNPSDPKAPSGRGLPVFEFKVLARGASPRARGYDLWQEGLPRAKAEAILARFDAGKSYPCWFDPADPTRAVLARTHNISWFLCGFVLVLPLNALGAGMLVLGLSLDARSGLSGPAGSRGRGT